MPTKVRTLPPAFFLINKIYKIDILRFDMVKGIVIGVIVVVAVLIVGVLFYQMISKKEEIMGWNMALELSSGAGSGSPLSENDPCYSPSLNYLIDESDFIAEIQVNNVAILNSTKWWNTGFLDVAYNASLLKMKKGKVELVPSTNLIITEIISDGRVTDYPTIPSLKSEKDYTLYLKYNKEAVGQKIWPVCGGKGVREMNLSA